MQDFSTVPDNHPLRKAEWIWPEHQLYLQNHFVNFRKDFELEKVPASAPLFITADQCYRLHVNGKYICRGPARGYQSHWPFDEVDISAYLQAGHNWISVECYNAGISTFQYIHQTIAGFLCAGEWDGFSIYSDREWLLRRCEAFRKDTARYSLQLNFQEHVDMNLFDRDWITSPKAPDWQWPADGAISGRWEPIPFGRPPYDTVEPRGIPMLREDITTSMEVTGHGHGKCREDYRQWQNITWEFYPENDTSKWDNGSTVTSSKSEESFEIEIGASGKGEFEAVSMRVQPYAVGTVIAIVDDAEKDTVLDFHLTEGICDSGAPMFPPPGAGCHAAFSNRMTLREGTNEHEFHHINGFRYLTVIARETEKPLKVKLAIRKAEYPFTMKGGFECSDKTLNDIFEICRNTQQACAIDAYMDTPWREQAQWWGDARIQAKNTFYIDGDARLLKRGIRSIAGQDGPGGLTYGHAPTIAYNCVLPDFSLTWILTIWDYYWQTGDASMVSEQWERIQKVLAYFDSPVARSKTGLLRYDTRLWYFGDWANIFKGDTPTYINMWYLCAMRRLEEMLEKAGMKSEHTAIKEKADAHEKMVMELLYDKEAKLFKSGLDENGQSPEAPGIHDQIAAMILGLAPEAYDTMIEKLLLPYLHEEELEGAVPSAFWVSYLFEEMGARGYAKEVIDMIRKKWSVMIPRGTTSEGYEWAGNTGSSSSHAWTSHPSFHFVNLITGITQTGVAWDSVKFAPNPLGGMDNAKAIIPSPKGEITAEWKKEGNEVKAKLSLPDNVSAEICLPDAKSQTVKGGEHEFTFKA